MKKAIVDVYEPASEVRFDALIPYDSQLSEVVILLVNICSNLAGEKTVICDNLLLSNRDNGEIYDLSKTVYDAGIRNGTRLLLT